MADQPAVFRNTASQKGRNLFATPQNSPLRYLSCGRILLDREVPEVEVDPGAQEVALICIHGEGTVAAGGKEFTLRPYDALYLPPGSKYRARTATQFDLAESLAPAEQGAQIQLVRFAEIKRNPELTVEAGAENSRRTVYKLIDTNIPAERLLAGVTFGKPGNWTSWAPHEHSESKEEVYLYIDMPAPAYGVQLVYDDEGTIDAALRVFENDAVAIHKGYHPNVGVPGYGIHFVWMMAALRPKVDRDWKLMHFQEDFLR